MTDLQTANFAVYETATGRFVNKGSCPRDWTSLQTNGDAALTAIEIPEGMEPPNYDTDYFHDGNLTTRPSLPEFDKLAIVANDVDTATVALPVGTVVNIDGVEYTIADGILAITSPMPERYVVTVKRWPFKDWKREVVAS